MLDVPGEIVPALRGGIELSEFTLAQYIRVRVQKTLLRLADERH